MITNRAIPLVLCAALLSLLCVGCSVDAQNAPTRNPSDSASTSPLASETVTEDTAASERTLAVGDIAVEDQGDYTKTAYAWVEAWLDTCKSMPTDSPAHIDDGEVCWVGVFLTAKEGLPKAMVFAATIWINQYPIDPTKLPDNYNVNSWSEQDYYEAELRLESDGKYHLVATGTGGGLATTQYDKYDLAANNKALVDLTYDVTVEEQGDYEKTAYAWVDNLLETYKALPADNPARIESGTVDFLKVRSTAKEGLPKALVFWVVVSADPTYSKGENFSGLYPFSVSEENYKDWGYSFLVISLEIDYNGRYHLIEMSHGGGLFPEQYDTHAPADDNVEEKNDIAVEDQGDYEKTARAWVEAWLEKKKSVPADSEEHLEDYAVDSVEINMVAKAGLPKAMIFNVKYSVKPTLPFWKSVFWMAGNGLEPSPGRDESWGQNGYTEIELRMKEDGKYHLVAAGTGGGYQLSQYILYDWVGDPAHSYFNDK